MSKAIEQGSAVAARLGLAASSARGFRALDVSRRGIANTRPGLQDLVAIGATGRMRQVAGARRSYPSGGQRQPVSDGSDGVGGLSAHAAAAQPSALTEPQAGVTQRPAVAVKSGESGPKIKLNLMEAPVAASGQRGQAVGGGNVAPSRTAPGGAVVEAAVASPRGRGGSSPAVVRQRQPLVPALASRPELAMARSMVERAGVGQIAKASQAHPPAGAAVLPPGMPLAEGQETSARRQTAPGERTGAVGMRTDPVRQGRQFSATLAVAPTQRSPAVQAQQSAQGGAASADGMRNAPRVAQQSAGGSDPAQAGSGGPTEGDVYLDGTLLGRWMARTLSDQAARPASGGAGFDPRRGVFPTGAMIGG